MKKDFLKYGNLIAFIAVVVFNVLATIGVLGGLSTRDVSYMYKSALTPADYAFSIWSVIYILVAVMVYRQIKNKDLSKDMGYLFAISCVLNIAWIFAWQFKQIALSFILILALLLDLLMLMKSTQNSDTLTEMAVGMYTGWINVAMLANLGTLFTRYNWYRFNGKVWAVIGLTMGIAWICYFIFAYSNIYYAIAALWGYLGIVMGSDIKDVKIMSIIGIIFFAASIIFLILKKKRLDATDNT